MKKIVLVGANGQVASEVAMLVDPYPREFAEAISRLIADEDVRDQMGERGRRLVAEIYNFSEFKKRLGECYEDVTRDR